MSNYSHSSYNRTATTNTTPSSHKHNMPPSNPASQQQNTRSPYSSPMLNSISSDAYGPPNSQIPYQQPPINSHHNGTFQLNPNAPPFHPAYSYHLHDIPSYVNAPMYDGYCPANAYDYQVCLKFIFPIVRLVFFPSAYFTTEETLHFLHNAFNANLNFETDIIPFEKLAKFFNIVM
uniref:Reverse transcriptase domain-containing protein n=1 Tax=Loa loa TaxID=7209 RepID=A0A1I7W293_LOALO